MTQREIQFILWISFFFTSGLSLETIICEGDTKTTTCCNGQVITVITAYYGRKSKEICPVDPMWDDNCYGYEYEIKDLCDGKTSCTLTASNEVFGQSHGCGETTTYLHMEFDCTGPTIMSATSQSNCMTTTMTESTRTTSIVVTTRTTTDITTTTSTDVTTGTTTDVDIATSTDFITGAATVQTTGTSGGKHTTKSLSTIQTSIDKETTAPTTTTVKVTNGDQTTSTFHQDTTRGEKQSTTNNVVMIVGISVLVVVVILLVTGLLVSCLRNRKLRIQMSSKANQAGNDDIDPQASRYLGATGSCGNSNIQRQCNKSQNVNDERVNQELFSDNSYAVTINGDELGSNTYVNFRKAAPGIFGLDGVRLSGSQDYTEMSDGKRDADQRHTGKNRKKISANSKVVDDLNKHEQVNYVNQTSLPERVEQEYMIPDFVQDKYVYLDLCDENGATQSENSTKVKDVVYEEL